MDYAIGALLYLLCGFQYVRHYTYIHQERNWLEACSFHVLLWPLFFLLEFAAFLWDWAVFVFQALQTARRKLKNA